MQTSITALLAQKHGRDNDKNRDEKLFLMWNRTAEHLKNN
jgi:hypothetical protein